MTDEKEAQPNAAANAGSTARLQSHAIGPAWLRCSLAGTAATMLTKDQIGKLSAEQQEGVAATEISRVRSRQELLDRARRGESVWAGIWMGMAGGLAILSAVVPRALPVAIIAVVWLIGYHVSRIHRRLNAIMELFDRDASRALKKNSDDDSRS